MAQELGGKLSARTLYAKLCDKKFRENLDEPTDVPVREHTLSPDTMQDLEASSEIADDIWEVEVFVHKTKFESLMKKIEYKRNDRGRESARSCLRLQPGKWEDMLGHGIYFETKLECGFHMKNRFLTNDGKSGTAQGT